MTEPKPGDLRVWWLPQVPMQPFYWPVESPEAAIDILALLAEYDRFQFENRIKPDYTNAGGLQVFDPPTEPDPADDGWLDWHHPETDEDIDDYAYRLQEESSKISGSQDGREETQGRV